MKKVQFSNFLIITLLCLLMIQCSELNNLQSIVEDLGSKQLLIDLPKMKDHSVDKLSVKIADDLILNVANLQQLSNTKTAARKRISNSDMSFIIITTADSLIFSVPAPDELTPVGANDRLVFIDAGGNLLKSTWGDHTSVSVLSRDTLPSGVKEIATDGYGTISIGNASTAGYLELDAAYLQKIQNSGPSNN